MKSYILMALICLFMACEGSAGNKEGAEKVDTATRTKNIIHVDTATLEGDWYLQPVQASDTAAGRIPRLRFDTAKSHFSGNTGCNGMNGTFWYSANDSSLVFSDKFAATRVNCTGYNEVAFIKNLLRVNHYRFRNGNLLLMFDESEISEWCRKPATPRKFNKA